jgi:hypothetical protein
MEKETKTIFRKAQAGVLAIVLLGTFFSLVGSIADSAAKDALGSCEIIRSDYT